MSTLANSRRTTSGPMHVTATVVVALGTLIAIGVTALVLALSGVSRTSPVTYPRSAAHPALGQYPGTGVARAARSSELVQTTSGYLRPEKSHGAVP